MSKINLPPEVAIVALGHSSRDFYPSEHGFVIGINNAHDALSFDPDLIVAMDDLERDAHSEPDYVDCIVNAGCPVITTRSFKQWPACQPYPIKEAVEYFGGKSLAQRVLSNTVNYTLALCLLKKVKEVSIYGCDFVERDKKFHINRAKGFLDKSVWPEWTIWYMDGPLIRKPVEPGGEACHYLLGMLAANEVKLSFPPETSLLNLDRPGFFYGFQDQPDV